jgi:hypothetical protein
MASWIVDFVVTEMGAGAIKDLIFIIPPLMAFWLSAVNRYGLVCDLIPIPDLPDKILRGLMCGRPESI